MIGLRLSLGLAAAVLFLQSAVAVPADKYANIHTVGVISRIGDVLTLKRVGLTIFSNSEEKLPIADWGIDKMVRDSVATEVASRFTVKDANADMAPYNETPEELIGDLSSRHDVDAYIVIVKSRAQDIARGSNQYLEGLGLYRRDLFIGSPLDLMYAYYQVEVVDSKTRKIIDYGTAQLTDGSFLSHFPAESHNDPANWSETPEAMSDAQKEAVRTQMQDLIQKSLVHALRSAKLIPVPTDR